MPSSKFIMTDQYNTSGLYAIASFLKGQAHQGIFSLEKGRKLKFVLEHFKGTKAMTRGHAGNRLWCLREVSYI